MKAFVHASDCRRACLSQSFHVEATGVVEIDRPCPVFVQLLIVLFGMPFVNEMSQPPGMEGWLKALRRNATTSTEVFIEPTSEKARSLLLLQFHFRTGIFKLRFELVSFVASDTFLNRAWCLIDECLGLFEPKARD